MASANEVDPLLKRDGNIGVTASRCRFHRRNNLVEMPPDEPPRRITKYDNRDPPITEILLIAHILVGREQQIETRILRQLQQRSVCDPLPAKLPGLGDLVIAQRCGQAPRHPLIKLGCASDRMRFRPASGCANRNRWRVEAAGGKFENSLNLLPCDVILLDDLLDARSQFEVFKDSGHGHSRIAEHPLAAPSIRHTLNNGTSRPIQACHGICGLL